MYVIEKRITLVYLQCFFKNKTSSISGLKGCRVYIGVSWGLSFLFSLSAIIMFRVNYEETQCGIIKMNSKEWQVNQSTEVLKAGRVID